MPNAVFTSNAGVTLKKYLLVCRLNIHLDRVENGPQIPGAATQPVDLLAQAQTSISSGTTRFATIPGIRVPSHSAWFDAEKISDIERRALPEFFDGSSAGKTPDLYDCGIA